MHRIIPEAIKAHGKLDVGLPPAPFRLADRSESEHAMRAADFTDVVFVDVTAVLEWPLATIMDFIEKGLVRVTMLLFAQSPQARQRIKQAIERDLAVDAVGGKLRLPVPALVVAGEKA